MADRQKAPMGARLSGDERGAPCLRGVCRHNDGAQA
jgi:hypothetical protein